MTEPTLRKKPKSGDWVQVLYSVFGTDGSLLEERRDAQRPFTFRVGLGAVSSILEEIIQGMEVGTESSTFCPPLGLLEGSHASKDAVKTYVFLKGIGKPPPRGQDVAIEVQKRVQRLIDSAVDDRQFGNANMKEGKVKDAKQYYETCILRCTKLLERHGQQVQFTDDLHAPCPETEIINCLVSARSNLSLCYFKLGKYHQCCRQCTKVLKRDPNHVKATFRRAQACVELQDYDLAKSDLERCLTLEPGLPEAVKLLTRLGSLMQKQAQREKSVYANLFKGQACALGSG